MAERKKDNGSLKPKLKRKEYEEELKRLQGELCQLQEWAKRNGLRVIILFGGRDATGKGGTIKAITERVSPRVFRVLALPAPSDREKSQMYLQRYVQHFPAAAEILIFDRSWYNRAGVEYVMGFCTEEQHRRFSERETSALAVKEKETGTIEQLMMTPAQTGEMLLAKTSPVFVLMMVVLFVALITGVVIFGLPVRGSLWLFALAGGCAALAGIGIGVMISTVSKSQQQAQLLTFFVNPVMTLLSGATSPIDNMPDFFQKLSYIDPLRYMVTIIRGVTLKNAPWSALWPNLLVLATCAIVLFSISAWRFRKQ
jgi:hypothetical protein